MLYYAIIIHSSWRFSMATRCLLTVIHLAGFVFVLFTSFLTDISFIQSSLTNITNGSVI